MKRLLFFSFLALLSLAPVDSAPKLPPAVLYSTMLNGISFYQDGRMSLSRLTGYFIPRPQTSTGSQYLYNPDDGASMNAVIRDSQGKTVATFGVYAMPASAPAWRFDSFRNLADKSMDYQFTQTGNYTMTFEIDGKPFQEMSFSVSQSESDDPYASGATWSIHGDWEDYGYLHIPNASASSTVTFKKWFRADTPGYVQGSAKILGSNGTVIAEAPEANYSLKPEWARSPFQFRTSKGALTGGELFSKPGSYTLRISIDGKTQDYPFEVANGTIRRQGRQAFDANPVERIEGGRDAWWLQAK